MKVQNMVGPKKSGKTLRSAIQKNCDKPTSSKQACNGNCQSCNKICSYEDPVVEGTCCICWFISHVVKRARNIWFKWKQPGEANGV